MLKEEAIVRDVFALWASGLEGVLESYRTHHHPDLHWWNTARGSVHGLETCGQGVKMMFSMLGTASVKVPIKNLMAREGFVLVERSDDLYRADGSLIAAVPVTGAIEFKGDKIITWRDYCDDWMRDWRPPEASKSLVQ